MLLGGSTFADTSELCRRECVFEHANVFAILRGGFTVNDGFTADPADVGFHSADVGAHFSEVAVEPDNKLRDVVDVVTKIRGVTVLYFVACLGRVVGGSFRMLPGAIKGRQNRSV